MTIALGRPETRSLTERAPQPQAPPARAHPGAVLGLIFLGAVLVLSLWWSNADTKPTLGDWLTEVGRITGLLAGYAVVVLLALMARIPALERGIGSDRLARWHALGGRYTVTLVVAHGLFITWGYAVTAQMGVLDQGKTLVLTYPNVMMATVAGLLFVMIGAVSARAARKRMRYETWHFLHFYTYLAIALAFSHQFSTGKEFVDNPTARVVWSTMYVVVGALLIWYRFLAPVRLAFRHQLRITDVIRESKDIVSIYMTGVQLHRLHAEPGQFFRWRVMSKGLWYSANPYSLSAPVHMDLIRITVRLSGDHSRALAAVRPGTWVFPEGPYGAFTSGRQTQRKVLLLGGGVGVTPLRTLFETLPVAPGDLTMVYRASREADIIFRDEFEVLAAQSGHHVHFLVGSRGELGYDPLAADKITELIPDLTLHDVYVCGPDGMVAAALRSLREAGVAERRIHLESFAF
ncbi:MAG: ferredoxin reductase family protein [Actinomycetota bacterium]|nr:ferredoxin reductase family protein [Actinomycetota bacterium]